ncbi:hypothetical protein FOZ60_010212 [Perkinsus olseni]|uniref:Uncharacterized protein n=1 Tax=Perkinsus olseni TaxID=32597 RepID=A0A7J6NFY1_PEROL|nr:hypothetical protein FOZ60_010212 [Perkinsus olseni]
MVCPRLSMSNKKDLRLMMTGDDGPSVNEAGPSDDSDLVRSGSGMSSSTSSSALDVDSPENNDVSSSSKAPEAESAHEETDNDDLTSEVPLEWNSARDPS